MTKTQLRVNAIRRESGYNQAKPHNIVLLILSNKAKQEQRQPYIPRPSNAVSYTHLTLPTIYSV